MSLVSSAMMNALITVAIACLASLVFVPIVRFLARKYGLVDRPDGHRKIHNQAVALGGGLAVLMATLVGVFGYCSIFEVHRAVEEADPTILSIPDLSLWGLLVGSVLLCLVGLYDDRVDMRGVFKLFWQVIASMLIIGTGMMITKLNLFGLQIHLGFFGVLFTLFWLLAAVNSLNLIDGTDGLAASVGIVFSITLGIIATLVGHGLDAVVSFAIAGALLGFLRFNFPPASIYLGDAGSMVIGLALGTLALRCSLKEAATLAFAGPLAVWAIPIFDSAAAFLRRKLTGRSMYSTDRGHIHHRLLTRGLSPRMALAFIVGLCVLTAGGALAGIYFHNDLLGAGSVLVVLAALIATRVFGHVELLLLNDRIMGFGRSIVRSTNGGGSGVRETSHRLQGSYRWEKTWEALVESAERFNLTKIRMNLYIPHLHEDFFASWQRKGSYEKERTWQAGFPLTVNGKTIGRLEVAGLQDSESASVEISHFLDFVEPLETCLRAMVDGGLQRNPEEHLAEIPDAAGSPKPQPIDRAVNAVGTQV